MKRKLVAAYGLLSYHLDEESNEETIDEPTGTNSLVEDVSDRELRIAMVNLRFTIDDGHPVNIDGFPFLFIGSIGSAYHKENLLSAGITHILCLSSIIHIRFPESFEYLRVPIRDQMDYDLSSDLSACIAFIDCAADSYLESLELGTQNRSESKDKAVVETNQRFGKVLVHCYQGKSRSAAVCCAYIMARKGWSLDEALDIVRRTHPKASPNSGFLRSLQHWALTENTTSIVENANSKVTTNSL